MTRRHGTLAVAAVLLVALGVVLGSVTTGAARQDSTAQRGRLSAVDIGFLQDMLVHHQQAITMTDIVRHRGDGDIAKLADLLRTNQLQEIGEMSGMLTLWRQPLISSNPPMRWMAAPGNQDTHHAADNARNPQVTALAQRMATEQAKENQRMAVFLDNHDAKPLTAPG